jgi:iron complex transport system substrate-binding protein
MRSARKVGRVPRFADMGLTKLEAALLIALITVLCCAAYAWFVRPIALEPVRQTITIVDSAGRYVEVPWPVRRVAALSDDSALALTALGAKDAIVGLFRGAIGEPWAPDVPNIGCDVTPYIETIVATRPDVLITWVLFPEPGHLEEKLKPFGIEVVRFDFITIETLFTEIRLLGLLLNRTEKAEELIEHWGAPLKLIKERTGELKPEQRLKVYWESWVDYLTYGPGSGLHEAIVLAGGINVFAGSPIPFARVSPEAVIEKNPDVIIKFIHPKAFMPWKATDPSPLEELRNAVMARPGWGAINAVKNGRVYILGHTFLHEGFGLVAEIALVARLLYPELFEDIHYEDYLRHWLENNLGIEYGGIWVHPPLG